MLKKIKKMITCFIKALVFSNQYLVFLLMPSCVMIVLGYLGDLGVNCQLMLGLGPN